MGTWSKFEGHRDLHFTVDGEPVFKINNRYSADSKSLPKFVSTGVKMYEELIWGWNSADDEDYPVPAVAPIKKDVFG